MKHVNLCFKYRSLQLGWLLLFNIFQSTPSTGDTEPVSILRYCIAGEMALCRASWWLSLAVAASPSAEQPSTFWAGGRGCEVIGATGAFPGGTEVKLQQALLKSFRPWNRNQETYPGFPSFRVKKWDCHIIKAIILNDTVLISYY